MIGFTSSEYSTILIERDTTKRLDIGAALTIAVSSTGFSKPAIQKARLKGIEIRVLKEITDAQITGWLSCTQLESSFFSYKLVDLALAFYDLETGKECRVAAEVEAAYKKDPWNAQIFIQDSDGASTTLQKLVDRIVRESRGRALQGLPTDGTEVRRRLRQEIGRGVMHIVTNQGPKDLQALANCSIHVESSLSSRFRDSTVMRMGTLPSW